MEIIEIRKKTGLNQKEFANLYMIPVSSLRKWESPEDSSNHRDCPEYVKLMLERLVSIDFGEKSEKNDKK